MTAIETKLDNLGEKIDDHICEQRKDMDKLFGKFDDMEKKYDEKFAGKWVEERSVAHAKRLRNIELKWSVIAGGAIIVALILNHYQVIDKLLGG